MSASIESLLSQEFKIIMPSFIGIVILVLIVVKIELSNWSTEKPASGNVRPHITPSEKCNVDFATDTTFNG
ncbi:MAG: hypothetical protein ACYCVB_10280 [Bacilli bacterium]